MVDIPRPRELTVGLLYRHMGDKLNLKPVDDGTGHSRIVISQDISRPGMALTGYMHKFLHERIQILERPRYPISCPSPALIEKRR